MLENISRSRVICVTFLLLLFSCAEEEKFYHTEVTCPGKAPILVRYTNLEEVKASIAKNNEDKKKFKTSEDYTVIYASGGRSVKIQGVSPEKILECSLRSIPVLKPDKRITKYN